MNKKLENAKYIAGDFLSSALAWSIFYIYRKVYIDPTALGYKLPLKFDFNYYLAILLVPIFWIAIYALIGSYKNIYRKSRIKELASTFIVTFSGTVVLFFILLLDDWIVSYKSYRYTFATLLILQFSIIYIVRFIQLTRLKNRLKNRISGFNTIMVGGNESAVKLYNELENEKYSQGYKFIGFTSVEDRNHYPMSGYLQYLGGYTKLPELVDKFKIEEVVIAIESAEHHRLEKIISILEDQNVFVKILPDMYDIITGMVKMNYIFGTALIEIQPSIMPQSQKNIKRLFDIIFSALVIIIGLPVFVFIAIGVYITSRGPIFYRQERIGQYGNPFTIYKFRTMYQNAEEKGPMLSRHDDPRVTPFGKLLRKYRLDELPQFYNVLNGDMSLVGPRPERQFFIDKIIKLAPHYKHLLKVKPGITSWGQVKFGYAENVDQMVDRLKFDILYIENMSLSMDIKILFYTLLIILQGSGK